MRLQQKQFDHLLKNIPSPSKTTYMKSFIKLRPLILGLLF